MGFAKSFEDIEDRYGEDTGERYEKYLKEVTHVPQRPKQVHSGEIWATLNGRRFEDYMAFPCGTPIRFCVDRAPDCKTAKVELDADGSARALAPEPNGNYTISSKTPATAKLRLRCGAYTKEHQIHFLEATSIAKIPEVAELISALTENPPEWSTESFPPFRRKLDTILTKRRVPKQFGDGVIEYHLSLFYENQRSPTFGKLLERANELLRCFTPFSDYAALICAFYLFRTNAFEYTSLVNISRLPNFRRLLQFFTVPFSDAFRLQTNEKQLAHSVKLDLLVPEPDHVMLQALLAANQGRLNDAATLVTGCWRLVEPDFDIQRERRLTFLEARVYRVIGDAKRAAACYERIRYSAQPHFRREAQQFLSTK